MQLWKKMKKNRKGFTLVEIIVVLVILAILAAFTIPAMLGFVNDAKKKANIAIARECYVAAQSAATELAATTTNSDKDKVKTKADTLVSGDLNGGNYTVTLVTGDVAKVDSITYTSEDGKDIITLTAGADGGVVVK